MVTLADLQEFLRRSGLNDREAACAASAAQVALQQKREAFHLDSQRLRFIWLLLPEFWERPTAVAAVAAANRAMKGLLCAGDGQLHISHLSLHPNSLALVPIQRSEPLPALRGCLMKIALDRLLSVQFHMPRLPDVLALLEGLAGSSCRCLRKIVDRQSRWRPRELQFEQMEEVQRRWAARVMELLNQLPNLQHLEGSVFSVLLRARNHAFPVNQAFLEDPAIFDPAIISIKRAPPGYSHADCNGGQVLPTVDMYQQSLSTRLRVLHLVDLCAADLFGLLPSGEGAPGPMSSVWPFCPNLQKLLLLNLPSAHPGLTAKVICKFLPQAPALKELQLDFQYFDPALWDLEALEALIARVQAQPSKINKLILDWCRLGDAGVRCVCNALAHHVRHLAPEQSKKCGQKEGSHEGVKELSLAHCELKDLSNVCEMLETPGLALTSLDLSANSFGDDEGLKLAKSLPFSSIKELRLRDSQVSERMPVKTKWSWGC